jgi:hypothetical protein
MLYLAYNSSKNITADIVISYSLPISKGVLWLVFEESLVREDELD